jgi:hypothetical protein
MMVLIAFGVALIGYGMIMRMRGITIPEWPGDDEYLILPKERRTPTQRLAALVFPRGIRRSYAAGRRTAARDTIVFGVFMLVLGVLGLVYL